MNHRATAAMLAATFLSLQCLKAAAQTQNQMNYHLVTAQEAASLQFAGGALGMNIVTGEQIHDGGLDFELLKISGVQSGTPGAQAGLHPGDQIIAADGRVFPSLKTFAAYVGSIPPGRLMSMDYIPSGGGPQQAQRIGVTVGNRGRAVAPAQTDAQPSHEGLSTGTKIAIGVGAAALFGCYEMGCFSRKKANTVQSPSQSGYSQRQQSR